MGRLVTGVARDPESIAASDAEAWRTTSQSTMKVGLVYDMDACRSPTGVTRHALAQLDRLRWREGIDLRVVSGRMSEPDGLVYWESLGDLRRRELPVSTRNALRWWRLSNWPPLEWWTGPVDWLYCPAEYGVPNGSARLAVTSHDVLQNLRFNPSASVSPQRMHDRLARMFAGADLILSVSHFNTARLLEFFPECAGRVEYVPNAAEDLFFEPATDQERAEVRHDLGLPSGVPFVLSVANFQARKNLTRLLCAAAQVPEIARGALALVLLGDGTEVEEQGLRAEVERLDRRMLVRLPGYRQGRALRAAYAESSALVFPSLCESFGIPVVEAMAQGVPVALANSTALPEVGGEAGWYFAPEEVDAMADALNRLLTSEAERARRVCLGKSIAAGYRWQAATDRLVAALTDYRNRPRRGRS